MSEEGITIVQLARFGDLIQTSPLVLNLARDSRGRRAVTLVVDSRSAPAASLLEGVDEVVGVDLAEAARIMQGDLARDFRELKRHLRVLAELPEAKRVLLLNQGALPSAVGALIPARRREGVWLGRPLPAPHRYLEAVLGERSWSPVHLSEVWAAYGPRRFPLPEPRLKQETLQGTGFAFFQEAGGSVQGKTALYAINISAGARGRTPGTAMIAPLVRELTKRGAHVVLLGSRPDREEAERMRRSAVSPDRAVNLAGRTTLAELAGILAACDLLISPDTGTLQLAAASKTPSLGLFFGGANPVETGAYREGAVALVDDRTLEQDEDRPWRNGEKLDPEDVADLAEKVATKQPLEEADDAFDGFHLLVARASAVGLVYTPLREETDVPVGQARRWLPQLRRLLWSGDAGERHWGGTSEAGDGGASRVMQRERRAEQWYRALAARFEQDPAFRTVAAPFSQTTT